MSMKPAALWKCVMRHLKQGYSPEQIAGDRREKTDSVRVRENADLLTLERIKKCPKECV